MAQWAAEHFFKIFLGVIVVNLIQRRRAKRNGAKSRATLLLSLAVFLLMVIGQFVVVYGGSDLHFLAAVLLVAFLIYRYRAYTLPFPLRSPKDGRRFTLEEVLFVEDPDASSPPAEE